MLEYFSFAQGILLLVVAFVAAASDLLRRKISNRLCLFGFLAGAGLSYMRGGMKAAEGVSLQSSAIAMFVAGGVFFMFYLLKGVEGGDVKLAAALGALAANTKFTLWILANTSFAGVPLALWYFMKRGEVKRGVGRGVKSAFTWRFVPKKKKGDRGNSSVSKETSTADAVSVGDGVVDEGADVTNAVGAAEHSVDGETVLQVKVPYAVAICVGVVWTVLLYLHRGAPMPIF